MHWLWRRYVRMDSAGDGGAAGAGGGVAGGAAGSNGGAGAGAGAAGVGGTAGGTGGAAGTGGAGDGSGAGGAAAASALAGGAAGASTAPNLDWLPEKYRVNAADGTLDLNASAQKLAGGYGELSKRFGEGGAAPKAAEEYTVGIPDNLKEVVGDLGQDQVYTGFRGKMHELGLSQKQFDGVMEYYFQTVPKLAQGAQDFHTESATAELRKAWTDDAAYKQNVGLSYRAATSIAQAAGMSFDDIEKAGLANNPTFIKMMAAIGPEFGEDSTVGGESVGGLSSEADIQKLLASEANLNPKHADYKATRAKVDAYYARKYGTATVS
ncbi:hypothetical protein SAMN04487926_12152 [Paraburkholderia steynii]|uniref:Uncharacterized protein n=1 Tax=Paraburkholderia steynii TaxID=1245441 RepID=A0A7Z7BBZ4_9BURK|nr:hypothetical protein [Paraburkholderia steynii]SDI65257.1 hypothetical protein SAMN04487926_12152 [Paraburkholderia steynii]